MGVPLNHPFKYDFPIFSMIFHEINHPAIGDPPVWKPPNGVSDRCNQFFQV